ncbi:FtsQ-type POTRA domain-containing protein [Streptococcus suis]|nr:FtsQ-type POTRA domain-containing protein [Streptococcus suis]
MTEKDSKIEKGIEEVTISEESQTTTLEDEKSDFFEQWKARHQAYLASQRQSVVSETTDVTKNIGKPKKLFEGVKLSKTITEVPANHEETAERFKINLPTRVVWKAIPVLVVSLLLMALSLYFISPTSKHKKIEVEGNNRLTAEQIQKDSLISAQDYAITIALHAKDYANNILKNNCSVESAQIMYRFPDAFTIQIKEYAIIGYIQELDSLYSVLASGEINHQPIAVETLPEVYTTITISDKKLVKKLAVALSDIDDDIRGKIQTINLTPSKVTADLLTLKMVDGNVVLVPLSELDQKLPYYTKIAEQVFVPTTIDMEVGIYRYSS